MNDTRQGRNMKLVLSVMLIITMPGMAKIAIARNATSSGIKAVDIVATVSKSDVRVAEPFQFEISVTAPSKTKIVFPAVDDQLGEFDVIQHRDVFDIPVTDSADRRSWTRYLTLESIVTGELEIPAVEVQIDDGSSNPASVNSNIVNVRIASLLEDRADPTRFCDIQSVVDVAVPQSYSTAWIWWFGGGLGAFAVALTFFVVIAWSKKYLTPAQWALGELDDLLSSDATRGNDSETVLGNLSSIVREYLQMQFAVSTIVQTTQELLQDAKHSQYINEEQTQRFGELLRMSDLAKFGGLQLTPTKLQQLAAQARSLVEETSSASTFLADEIVENTTNRINFGENQ